MEKKMTQKEFYTGIVANEAVEQMYRDYAEAAIAKIEAANEKAKAKRAEKSKERKAEDVELMATVAAILGDEPKTAGMVKAELESELSVQKFSTILRAMVADGVAAVTDVKVSGKGTQRGYTKA